MIRFPCNCGNEIAVREDMAGDVTQCGRCGRLVDIPYLEDLDKIDRDGAFKINVDTPNPDNKLDEVPGQGVVLEYRGKKGKSPDRRTSLEKFMAAGAPADFDKPAKSRPKYDPETGELIAPLDIADRGVDAQTVTPIDESDPHLSTGGHTDPRQADKSSTLRYADRNTQPRVSLVSLPVELFMAHNAFVIMILFAGHILLNVYFALPLAFILFLSLAGFLLMLGVVGHYGNTIEDTGPEQRDEIPTLFRNASFAEDIWLPFVRVVVATCVCFWPMILVQAVGLYDRAAGISAGVAGRAAPEPTLPSEAALIALGLCAITFFAFPAVLLITCTSGSMANLAPHRIARTMWGGGLGYIWCLMLFAMALAVTLGSTGAFNVALALAFDQLPPVAIPTWAFVLAGSAGTLIGVYLLHLACFSLGLVYRKHHGDFRWVHQHFEKVERDDAMSKLEKFHKRERARQRAKARRSLVDTERRDERQLAALRK
ncbi:MAG: hypothetical protein AAGD32_07000 [Planctomycetota bacterium]